MASDQEIPFLLPESSPPPQPRSQRRSRRLSNLDPDHGRRSDGRTRGRTETFRASPTRARSTVVGLSIAFLRRVISRGILTGSKDLFPATRIG